MVNYIVKKRTLVPIVACVLMTFLIISVSNVSAVASPKFEAKASLMNQWENISWEIEGEELHIGPGVFPDKTWPVPWGSQSNNITKVVFDDPSNTSFGEVTDSLFSRMSKVVSIQGIEDVDFSNVKSARDMFSHMTSLTDLNVSKWDTGNLTNSSFMFYNDTSLSSIDVSTWKTGKITTLASMFWNTPSLTSIDVSNWDVRNVYSISSLFGQSGVVSLDLSAWDAPKLQQFTMAFYGATDLTTLDISSIDTTKGVELNSMLLGASSLSVLTLGDKTELTDNVYLRELPPADSKYTGEWVEIGSGTIDFPKESKWMGLSESLIYRSRSGHGGSTYVLQEYARVGYDANSDSATGVMEATTGKTGFPIVISDNEFSLDDSTFDGWNDLQDGSGNSYSPLESGFFPGGDTTLYAQWENDTVPQPTPTDDGLIDPSPTPTDDGLVDPSPTSTDADPISSESRDSSSSEGSSTANETANDGGSLARTGSTVGVLGIIATLLTGAGILFVRQRRSKP